MKSTRRGLFGVVLGAAVSAVGTIMGWGKGGPVPEPKESADHPTPSCVRMWYDDVEIYPPNVHYQYHSGTLVAITRSLGSKNFHGNTFTYTSSGLTFTDFGPVGRQVVIDGQSYINLRYL